jgi:hypothetical protein
MLDPFAETELGLGSCSLRFSRWGGVEVDFFCAGSLQKSASAFDFFRSSVRNQQDFDGSLVLHDPPYRTGDIVGRHRLDERRWQAHFVAVSGKIGGALDEFKEPRCANNGIGIEPPLIKFS